MRQQKGFKYLLFILVGGVLITLLGTGCKRSEKIPQLSGDSDYNLLIITIDTLRPDRLGCYGFANAQTPNIQRLSEKGVIFKHCYSPVPITLPSYCTIFTGRGPSAHRVRNNLTDVLPQEEITMAEIFEQQGFQTHAVISLPALMGKFGLNQGFQNYDDSLDFKGGIDYRQNQVPAGDIYAKFKNWFANNRDTRQRFFSWVHFSDPHAPYDPPEKYKEKFPTDPYSGEIAVVDHYIGKIVRDLESQQLLDKTLIIITSGHGEAFGEHKEFGHGIFCYNESLKVPLIFANPALFKEGTLVYQEVSLLDIMPTVLHLYALENPGVLQGRSIAHLLKKKQSKEEPTRAPPLYFESMLGKEEMNLAPLTGIIIGGHKYISLPEAELYDLDKDPLEKENLIQQEPLLAKELERQLQEYFVQQNSTAASPGPPPLDPKKGIPILNQLLKLKKDLSSGVVSKTAANEEFEKITAEYSPTLSPYFYDLRHDISREQGKIKEAEEILKNGIATFPAIKWLRLKLAAFYVEQGQMDQAEKICRELLAANPRYTEAAVLLRDIYKKTGNINDTVTAFYEEAIKLEPLNVLVRLEYAEILLNMGKKEPVLNMVSALMENDGLMNNTASLDIKTNMGMLLLRMGQYDRTITLCLHMTAQGHKSPQVLNQLGKAYSGKGDFENALDAYNKALKLDEKSALTLSNLGTLYLTMFRVKKQAEYQLKAVEYYSRALEANPQMVPALNGLAVAHSFAGQPDKAVQYWQKALEINPGFSNVYFNLGITYLRMGKKKNALKYLNLLKERLYNRLSPREQLQLDNLIKEANQ